MSEAPPADTAAAPPPAPPAPPRRRSRWLRALGWFFGGLLALLLILLGGAAETGAEQLMTAEVWVHRLLEDIEGLGARGAGAQDVLGVRAGCARSAGSSAGCWRCC